MDREQAREERPSAAERPHESGAAALGRGGRMSRQRKREAVLRLLRGEDLETASRSLGVTGEHQEVWGGVPKSSADRQAPPQAPHTS